MNPSTVERSQYLYLWCESCMTQIPVAKIVKSVMHAKNKPILEHMMMREQTKQESHACKGNQAATHDTSSDLFTAGVHELQPS